MTAPTALVPGRTPGARAPLLSVRDLQVVFRSRGRRDVRAVDGVDLDVAPGSTVGIVGESGSGKSVTSLASSACSAAGAHVSGSVRFDGRDLLTLPDDRAARAPRREIAMIFQDPMSALNPVMSIGRQITEVLVRHRGLTGEPAKEEAARLLDSVGIGDARRRLRSYPHQLSGGMRQRVMIAMALACRPRLLIADEPTTALDVTISAQILELLRELVVGSDTALVLITHDLGVVAGLCDTVHVMYSGRIVESAQRRDLFAGPVPPVHDGAARLGPAAGRPARPAAAAHPRLAVGPAALGAGLRLRAPLHEGGRRLPRRAATARAGPREPGSLRQPGAAGRCRRRRAGSGAPVSLLEVRGLEVHFPVKKGLVLERTVGHVRAVDGVDLTVERGRTLGVVGESGCGKSTLGRAVLQLTRPTAGTVVFDGEDLTAMRGEQLRRTRRRMQMVFQDPLASLDPRQSVAAALAEPIRTHEPDAKGLDARVRTLLDLVGLPATAANRYPHEFSGGQRQRIGIARAIALDPDLVIADEPVSALDVSIQAQVINLLEELQERLGLTYVVIAHDLAVVRHISDDVAVMYLGSVVEVAPSEQLYEAPAHPYTRALLSAIPVPDPEVEDRRERILLPGDLPSPADPPSGCRFHTRCPWRQPTRCDDEVPALRPLGGTGSQVACHWAEQVASGELTPVSSLST